MRHQELLSGLTEAMSLGVNNDVSGVAAIRRLASCNGCDSFMLLQDRQEDSCVFLWQRQKLALFQQGAVL